MKSLSTAAVRMFENRTSSDPHESHDPYQRRVPGSMSVPETTLPESIPKPINGVYFDSLDVTLNQTLNLT